MSRICGGSSQVGGGGGGGSGGGGGGGGGVGLDEELQSALSFREQEALESVK